MTCCDEWHIWQSRRHDRQAGDQRRDQVGPGALGAARITRARRRDHDRIQQPDSDPVDDRAVTYSWAFFSAKQLGTGQFYLMTINDKNGDPFDGAAVYRLRVPAYVPVTLYWSLTAYDRADPHPRPGRAVDQPILEHPWPAGEFRRLGGSVFSGRSRSTGNKPTGSPPTGQPVRGPVPALRGVCASQQVSVIAGITT